MRCAERLGGVLDTYCGTYDGLPAWPVSASSLETEWVVGRAAEARSATDDPLSGERLEVGARLGERPEMAASRAWS